MVAKIMAQEGSPLFSRNPTSQIAVRTSAHLAGMAAIALAALSSNRDWAFVLAAMLAIVMARLILFAEKHPAAMSEGSRPDFGAPLIRFFDVLIAAALIAFLAPLIIAIAILIYVIDPGPIFFAQARIGRGGTTFPCIKFRTMVVDADRRLHDLLAQDLRARREWAVDFKLRDDPRITKLGAFLRKSSLDELPQLFNVLRGEMSLVGPRPIVWAEAPKYGRFIADYCQLRPGMTGLWQVSGRDNLNYRRRVAMDVVYSRSFSFGLYVRILAFAALKLSGLRRQFKVH